LIGPRPCSQEPQAVTTEADVVFITTPDGAIEAVCRQIAAADGFRAGSVVLHCSGALPSTILAAAGQSGAWVGSLHPLQSFAGPSLDRNPFAGIIVSVEGDGPALKAAEAMAVDLQAHPQHILTEAKTLYHAAAVVASNYLVTLLDLAFTLLKQAGVAPRDAHGVLRPLIDGTLANIARIGPPAALTGPVARGDAQTVGHHLQAIGARNPESLALYRALGIATVDVAEKGEHIDTAQAAALRRLMKP
jgi:predicted short-subunit dehydrogenase-like oxidoreductase (DUF2520 family)